MALFLPTHQQSNYTTTQPFRFNTETGQVNLPKTSPAPTTNSNTTNRTQTVQQQPRDTGSNNPTPQPSAPSQPSEPNWDELYSEAFRGLDTAENNARLNSTSLISDIGTAASAQMRDLGLEEANAKSMYESTQQKTYRNQQSANEKQVRDYNALNQASNSRFGRGSSTGAAVGELAMQEYFRQQGQTNQSYADIIADQDAKWNGIYNGFVNGRTKIDEWEDTQVNAVKRDLNNQLTQLARDRGTLASDKAAKRIEFKQTADARMTAIEDQKRTMDRELQQWKEQQAYLLQNNITNYTDTFTNAQTTGYSPKTTTLGTAAAALPTLRFNNKGQVVDDYGQVINVF